jgi:hypothetical protein
MAKYTIRDDSLPHQIRIVFSKPEGMRVPQIAVSCNCLRDLREGGARRRYKIMGYASTTERARAFYNDPANHDQTLEPFEPEDKLRGTTGDHHSGRSEDIAEQGAWQGGTAQGQ